MSTEQALLQRCESRCELCGASTGLSVYAVQPCEIEGVDSSVMICAACRTQVEDPDTIDVNHWHCLNTSMWSEVPVVKVMAWRMLKRLSVEGWAQDLLDMLYLDDETLQWAEAGLAPENVAPTLDGNGNLLHAGDTVTLIKHLDVKGVGFTAKRGTAVRNISLTENPEHIEGRVNGVRVVLLSRYLKKSN